MKWIIALVMVVITTACAPSLSPSPVPQLATPRPTQPPPTQIPSATVTAPPILTPTGTSAPAKLGVGESFHLRKLPGVGHDPQALALLGNLVYVVNTESDNVAVIQGDRVIKYIPVGGRPGAIAVDPANKRLYVANDGDKTISLIVNDTIVKTIGIGDRMRSLLFLEGHLFVGLDSSGKVLVLDGASLQTWTTITVPNAFAIINMAGDAQRHRLYVDIYEKVAVIDTESWKVLSIFETRENYYVLVAHPLWNIILTNYYDSPTGTQYLVAFDASSGAPQPGRAKIGGDPHDAVVSADATRVYVADSYTNDISVIDPRGLITLATIPVGMQPSALALNESAHRLYVASPDSDSVNVIDTDKLAVVATIPVGIIPTAILGSESTGRMYIANPSTDSVFVIQGARIVKEIGVGRNPIDLARDDTGRIFVANAADRTLSIIDEKDLSVRSTQPITRFLTTVAVDQARSRVYAEDVILDLKTLSPIGRLLMQGNTIGSQIEPDHVIVNPGNGRIYAVGWNGTPGSNSRSVTYSVDGDTLKQRTTIGYYGNTTALAVDPDTNRVFVATTHPIGYMNVLSVFDADDKQVISLPFTARTSAMVYNPNTHHLFLSHSTSYSLGYGPTPVPADNFLQILDTTSFGTVAQFQIPLPGRLGRLGNTIYVANRQDGSVTLLQDAAVAVPPSPTPTMTPTPYPTSTPTLQTTVPVPTATLVTRATPSPGCPIPTAPQFVQRESSATLARLGCATEGPHNSNFVTQAYERGIMFWREDEKRIYVLLNDKTWQAFDDTWSGSMPEDSCPSITVSSGLVKPRRGFGKVWCDQDNLREGIGAATVGEIGPYSAAVQRLQQGLVFGGNAGQVLTLYANGTWE